MMVRSVPRSCIECGENFLAAKQEVGRGRAKYCTKRCHIVSMQRVANTRSNCNCSWCGAPLWRKIGVKTKTSYRFCNLECKGLASRLEAGFETLWPEHYGTSSDGGLGRRMILRSGRPLKCEGCGFDSCPGVLQIHHRDRNRFNNEPENLHILCPTCHFVDHFKASDGMFSWRKRAAGFEPAVTVSETVGLPLADAPND